MCRSAFKEYVRWDGEIPGKSLGLQVEVQVYDNVLKPLKT